MPHPSTRNIYESHNEVILKAQDSTDKDDYFYSLCRPRYAVKKRLCLDCTRPFMSDSVGRRRCAKCSEIKARHYGITG